MRAIDRKLIRDLGKMKGQALAIALVMACGVATFVMSLNVLESLRLSQSTYYERYGFAQVFAHMKRAPRTLLARMAEIPGVSRAEGRIVSEVTLDIEGLEEPASGRLISLPRHGEPLLNRLYLKSGRQIDPEREAEVLASDAFAEANAFEPGDHLEAILNGRKQELDIVGIALSPEYIYQIREGEVFPDDRRFGVLWMGERQMEAAFDMKGAFNDVSLTLMPGASEADVLSRLDDLTEPYGGVGAIGRKDQVSNRYLSEEIRMLRGMGLVAPAIFLTVAAFLLNVVISRLVRTQREEIAALKAFGYSGREIGIQYVKLVLLIVAVAVALGTVAGALLGRDLTELYTRFYRFPVLVFRLDPRILLLAAAISVGAGVLGTSGAVRRAARLPPAEAMRPEPPALYRPTIVERMGLQRLFSPTARMVLRHLERHPLKALLSVLGIAMGVAVLVLGAFNDDALDYFIRVDFETAQRYDVSVALREPGSAEVVHDFSNLRGVLDCQAFRSVPSRLRAANREHLVGVTGLARGELLRLIGNGMREVRLPPEGLVISAKLAEMLGIRAGDRVTVEVLEGRRPVREVTVARLVEDFVGVSAYMDIRALNRLMQEGGTVSGAFLCTDPRFEAELYHDLKNTPAVASVTLRKAALQSFMETLAENMRRMRAFNVIFACIIAFGVVYNNARISLSERSRELASMRVLGFTRGEISKILLGELAVLTLLAVPAGLGLGWMFCSLVVAAVESELYRFPLVIYPSTYAFAALVIMAAALFSGLVVRRRLDHLDLVAVLKTKE